MNEKHEGHRERLRSRAILSDMSALKPHEVLEYVLFFAIPRHNLNPLAHDLLKEFGSLLGVFTAQPEELTRVSGISDTTANWLRAVGDAVLDCVEADEEKVRLLSRYAARRFMTDFFSRNPGGGCWMICLSDMGDVLRMMPLRMDVEWYAPENQRSLFEEALKSRCRSLILVEQSRAVGFGPEERHQVDVLTVALDRLGVRLLEYMRITPGGGVVCYSTQTVSEEGVLAEPTQLQEHWLDDVTE